MRMAFSTVVLALLAFIILYPACHAIYNTFLHPLHAIPGPKLWAASRIPWCWHRWKGDLHLKLLHLHSQYGQVVRVAPSEVSFTSASAWETIYGQRAREMPKDPTFSLLTPSGVQNVMVADRPTHARQRRLMSHAFSEKALREQEGIIQSCVTFLLTQLQRRAEDDLVDLSAWYNFASFDLIGDMAFGQDFGCLKSGDYQPFVRGIGAMAKELTFDQMWKYWGFMGLRRFFTPKEVAGKRQENFRRAAQTIDRRVNAELDRKDFLHYILAANDEKGMSMDEIHVNAFSLTIAGSESTATLMSGMTFLILTHPTVYERLAAEIRTAFALEEEITLASTNALEYLEAVQTEALRLYPPVAITMPRAVPAGGEVIDGYMVSENTTVGVNHYACYRDARNFCHPNDFLPQRWLQDTGFKPPFDMDNKSCMRPFSHGPRNCLGKNLAKGEVRLIMARMLFRFDLELLEGQTAWLRDQKLHGFWSKQPLRCRIRPVVSDK